ncbi:MAG: phenylacetate-CoA oxygenase subunit PaaJ [Chitinophagales bacterium]|nr:phenylacetate-CoA oxygenase subunit PaaJ [Chitinophagaceae bacterium]MCB9063794.1 phenylacetate-CoA oxygenase subunit PaaJ [Chitinophagales bacterium]
MVAAKHTKEEIFELLSQIVDPEIPAVTIEEIGMLQDVNITETGCEVIITPTYTGCPAMGIIEADIKALLDEHGIEAKVKLVYDPAWTTDMITDVAKEKMRKYGIAPPVNSSCGNITVAEREIECPQCGSQNTEVVSRFGSTACKALYKCNDCKEPFEYFKCH